MSDNKLQTGSSGTGNTVRWVVLGGTFVAALGISSLIPYMVIDDFAYLSLASQSPGILGFILGYVNMMLDGRVATAASLWLVYTNNIWLWRICNAAAVTLFCFLVCKIACLIAGEKQPRWMPQVFVCASLAIVNTFVVALPMFTICFSVHYLWACTAALLALYYPVKEAFCPEENKVRVLPYCLIAASVYACLAQEQVAAVMVAFLLIITIYRHNEYRKRREAERPLLLYIQTALSWLVFLLNLALTLRGDRPYHMTSDGGQVTLAGTMWYSDGSQRVFRVLQWLAYNYMIYAKYVLILLWVLLLLRFMRKKQPIYCVLCALFAAAAILSVLLPAFTDVGLFSEGPSLVVQMTRDPSALSLSAAQGIVLIWWLFAIGFTPLLLLKALKDEPMRYAAPLLYLAGGACACLMTATNAMYHAMGRTFFVTAILLLIIVASLIPSSIKKPKHMLLAACVLVLFAAAQLLENFPSLIAAGKEFFNYISP